MDIFARFGGEEFVILMPDTDEEAALKTAKKLRKLVGNQITSFDRKNMSVTISSGVSSEKTPVEMDIPTLLDKADKALYQSKENGRNQLAFAD